MPCTAPANTAIPSIIAELLGADKENEPAHTSSIPEIISIPGFITVRALWRGSRRRGTRSSGHTKPLLACRRLAWRYGRRADNQRIAAAMQAGYTNVFEELPGVLQRGPPRPFSGRPAQPRFWRTRTDDVAMGSASVVGKGCQNRVQHDQCENRNADHEPGLR